MPVPYIIFLVLYAISFTGGCFMHGKILNGNQNAGSCVFVHTLKIGLLVWGGFFNQIGWPQIWIAVLSCIDVIITILKDGKPFGRYNVSETIIGLILTFVPLYFGGFFG
jgi:hypothetical protein